MQPWPTLCFSNVSVAFDNHTAVQALNLTLAEQRIGIIGANGSGKSTFARLINGLVAPTHGTVNIDGLDTVRDGKAIRRKVGFVFQNPDNQIVMPTVEEDLAFGLTNLKLDKEEIEKRIETTLQHYHLTALRQQAAHSLSGGQKQLLAICGVLVIQPQTIVLDEPTTQLDLRNKRQIAAVIEKLNQQIIMVTHDLPLLTNFNRVLVFDNGHLVCDAPPAQAIAFYEQLMA
ncbi:MAG: Biotin transport system ATP-binding protein [Candidatus Tokpelaia hoelldobleri]|uniref:Biotin transport system ATP-binding protein n=1 Tax=Candidatus Tokpelaia hoelldobleri TaxID=1902579 RepID=A0A1U9JSD3_9HYPH|nr:MAG: Biotin transport system ATP-binding protein [Candidatus Tokpelaia hoelldoblerii]